MLIWEPHFTSKGRQKVPEVAYFNRSGLSRSHELLLLSSPGWMSRRKAAITSLITLITALITTLCSTMFSINMTTCSSRLSLPSSFWSVTSSGWSVVSDTYSIGPNFRLKCCFIFSCLDSNPECQGSYLWDYFRLSELLHFHWINAFLNKEFFQHITSTVLCYS